MPAKFRVTSQTSRPTFDHNSRPVDVFDVSFELVDGGDRGMISIPVLQYSAEAVLSAIQPLADQMAAVRQLGQG